MDTMEAFCCFISSIFEALASLISLFIPRWFDRRKKDIRGQRVLVTGAGSGVGRQLAIEFSKHGTCLLLVDINKQSLLETEKLLDRRSAVFTYECDVTDHRRVYQTARKVKEQAGDVDILVNNAGIVSGKYLLDLPEEKIRKTMEVNALAHFWTTKAFLPAMMKKNRGHVVSIASICGRNGGSKLTDYCASKFAAVGFAEALEVELREQKLDGVKVTVVYPSHIDTGMFQGARMRRLGGIMTPEYVAKEVIRGVLEERETVFLPRIFQYFAIIQDIVPRWTMIKLVNMTGNLRVMENFTGREQQNGVSKPVQAD